MLKKTIVATGLATAALFFAPAANADLIIDLNNKDVISSTPDPNKPKPVPVWFLPGVSIQPCYELNWSYKTGYNISPRYTFSTDPDTGKRRANYDNGCNGAC